MISGRSWAALFLCFSAFLAGVGSLAGAAAAEAATVPDTMNGLPLVFAEDFENGAGRWNPGDPKAWKVIEEDGNRVYSLHRQSEYAPPVRSPRNIARIKDLRVTDFVIEAKMKQTSREYGHRDMCIFFGYQGPSRFYYVHIATKADPHAHSVFLVNDAPRVSIAADRTDGADWGQEVYQKVRVERDTASGSIKVYFNDMTKPIITAEDKTFLDGEIGFGSFDDTGNIDDIRIWARTK